MDNEAACGQAGILGLILICVYMFMCMSVWVGACKKCWLRVHMKAGIGFLPYLCHKKHHTHAFIQPNETICVTNK